MIKASEGGGGKGIRKALAPEDVAPAYRQVTSEVAGPVFVMKLITACRHLEVQILADEHGAVAALSGRDCSVQRRHQKQIEEGPILATLCPPKKWTEMERAAVRLCREVGYVGAGTVEYLFADGEYYFLELNPRLQVEHPVTELVTGVNLPMAQILVTMGVGLAHVGVRPEFICGEKSVSDEICEKNVRNEQETPGRRNRPGHVIACRITAEEVGAGFRPAMGRVTSLEFMGGVGVWGYFSVRSGGRVHEFAGGFFIYFYCYFLVFRVLSFKFLIKID